MNVTTKRKQICVLILICSFCFALCFYTRESSAYAQSKYTTRAEAIKMILDELGVIFDSSTPDSYVQAAKKIGLITDKTFSNYSNNIKKSEMAVLIVRADEYINKSMVDKELIDKIIDCRISDINKVRKVYQPFLAKSYALGYIIGKSNGTYSTNRKFNPNNKITKVYAKQLVSMIKNRSKRYQISPDGQLIRTTNLPKLAEFYPYILASYPNSYYDWQFMFMRTMMNGKPIYGTNLWISKIDYASPADFFDYKNGDKVFYYYANKSPVSSKELFDECIDEWEENAKTYLECVFNVDYRTIKDDQKWLQQLGNSDISCINNRGEVSERVKKYIDSAINNKTIVKSSKIAVDRSSLYLSNDRIYLRAYVRYNIVSSESLEIVRYSPIICTRYQFPDIHNVEIGKWREAYVNIVMSASASTYGVENLILDDLFHDEWVVEIWEKD